MGWEAKQLGRKEETIQPAEEQL